MFSTHFGERGGQCGEMVSEMMSERGSAKLRSAGEEMRRREMAEMEKIQIQRAMKDRALEELRSKEFFERERLRGELEGRERELREVRELAEREEALRFVIAERQRVQRETKVVCETTFFFVLHVASRFFFLDVELDLHYANHSTDVTCRQKRPR